MSSCGLYECGLTTSDRGLGLGGVESAIVILDLVHTQVEHVEGEDQNDGKRDTVGPLSGQSGVRWAAAAVEDEEKDEEETLVEELTPTLHQEGEDERSTTVELVAALDFFAATNEFDGSGTSDGVFAADTNAIAVEFAASVCCFAIVREDAAGLTQTRTRHSR